MMSLLKRSVLRLLERNETVKKMTSLYQFRHHFEDIGWFKSCIERLPVDRNGDALPWYTYPVIYFLEKRVTADMRVFEYGSGNSTLWWSKRVASVVSCEHNRDWYDSLKGKMPSNVEYKYCEHVDGGQYSKVILEYLDNFDIIVIDGKDRVNCAKNTLKALTSIGVIIWDNSDRDAYREGYEYLLQNGFRRLDFQGYGPVNPFAWRTSIFYRANNRLGI